MIDQVQDSGVKGASKATVDALLKVRGLVVFRASPAEKAKLVQLVRTQRPEITTLAIGDGANDVNMIQQAHVGIGIIGKEGSQASSYADFAIGQFKDLRRLLFWHGCTFGFSLTDFCNLMFAKTMVIGTVGIFYNSNSGWSAGYFVEDILFIMYNMVNYGYYPIFEVNISKRYYQDNESKLPFKMSEAYSYFRDVYMKGMMRRFFIFLVFSYFGGASAYYVTYYGFGDSYGVDGQPQGLWTTGLCLHVSLVIFTQTLIGTNLKDWNWAVMLAFTVNCFHLFFQLAVANNFDGESLYKEVPYTI